MNLNDFIIFILETEGGKSNHKDDAGGKTNYGITQRAWDSYQKTYQLNYIKEDVFEIDEIDAIKFYKRLYEKYSFINKMPETLKWEFFDCTVNSGYGGASRILQRAINHKGANIAIDGFVGHKTLTAYYDVGGVDFMQARRDFYHRMVSNKPSQKVFLKGWCNRLDKLKKYLEI